MTASQALQELRAEGFRVSLNDEGGIAVRPASRLSAGHRDALQRFRADVLSLLRAEVDPPGANRRERYIQLVWPVAGNEPRAEQLADRLIERDESGDDRRTCIECFELRAARCAAASDGRLRGVDRRLEPVPTILHRCEAFAERAEGQQGDRE